MSTVSGDDLHPLKRLLSRTTLCRLGVNLVPFHLTVDWMAFHDLTDRSPDGDTVPVENSGVYCGHWPSPHSQSIVRLTTTINVDSFSPNCGKLGRRSRYSVDDSCIMIWRIIASSVLARRATMSVRGFQFADSRRRSCAYVLKSMKYSGITDRVMIWVVSRGKPHVQSSHISAATFFASKICGISNIYGMYRVCHFKYSVNAD